MALRAYRYRIYPTEEQKQFFDHHFGCCRFVYNHFLALRSEKWKSGHISLSGFACKKMLPDLKAEHPWLKDVNSQSLQASVLNLEMAFRRFFRGLGRYPSFHRKHGRQSFLVPQHLSVGDRQITIPKLGTPVKVKMHRPLGGKPKGLTIVRECSGKYYVSIVCECEIPHLPTVQSTVGIDLNLGDYAVLSSGEKIPHPKWLKTAEHRLIRLQRRLSHKVKGSNNRQKAKKQGWQTS